MRDHVELWAGALALIGMAVVGVHTATAESHSTFDRLRQLDRTADHHERASRRLSRVIRRWDETFAGEVQKGELAERAAGRLERKVTDQLVTWERLHRRIRRNAHLWPPGRGRDVARLLRDPEVETLRRRKETFKAIGRLESDVAAPAVLLRERARLTIELAQQKANRDAVDAEREEVIDRAKSGADAGLEEALRRTQKELERSLERLIEHETGEDFHRRKGTLLPPVSAEPAATFGRRKQPNSSTYVRHTGLTYTVEPETSVQAVADGLVVLAKRFEGYGNLVIVDHGDDYHSLYAHLREISVEVGTEIDRGSEVGLSGATDSLEGPKLYFELRHGGEPVDPQPWFISR